MVLPTGIEPVLDYSKQILSLQRLPIPPRELTSSNLLMKQNAKGKRDLGFIRL